jgi:hypothetical protein
MVLRLSPQLNLGEAQGQQGTVKAGGMYGFSDTIHSRWAHGAAAVFPTQHKGKGHSGIKKNVT